MPVASKISVFTSGTSQPNFVCFDKDGGETYWFIHFSLGPRFPRKTTVLCSKDANLGK